MAQIRIDRRYWQNARKDYSDWRFAWAREAGQNSLDAGATRVDATVKDAGDRTIATWKDNGRGMDRQTMIDKFLAIGATGKDFEGTTGGFGVAKIVLALCHIEWKIRTQNILAQGRNSDYEIQEGLEWVDGCELEVVMDDATPSGLTYAIKNWIRGTTTNCEFYVNGDRVETASPLGIAKRDLEWAMLYEHGEHNGSIHVRINGQLMFTRYTSIKASVVIEIKGLDSSKYLTSNRDNLQYEYGSKLDKVIEWIFADPDAILEREDHDLFIWTGTMGRMAFTDETMAQAQEQMLARVRQADLDNEEREAAASIGQVTDVGIAEALSEAPVMVVDARDFGTAVEQPKSETVPFMPLIVPGHDIVIVNKLNRNVPDEYIPGQMCEYARKVLARWNAILRVTGEILSRKEVITTGFVFKAKQDACWMKLEDVGQVLAVNPIRVDGTTVERRWDMGWGGFNLMLMAAVHEWTHVDWSYHGDGWASAYTYNMARVMCHQKTVNKLYSAR